MWQSVYDLLMTEGATRRKEQMSNQFITSFSYEHRVKSTPAAAPLSNRTCPLRYLKRHCLPTRNLHFTCIAADPLRGVVVICCRASCFCRFSTAGSCGLILGMLCYVSLTTSSLQCVYAVQGGDGLDGFGDTSCNAGELLGGCGCRLSCPAAAGKQLSKR
jgi:hypothetical protein